MNEKLYELLETVQRTAIQAGAATADVAYVAGRKAGELLSVAKLNIRIAGRKSDVNTAMRELGEMLYATHTGTPTDSEVLLAKMQEIDAMKAEIADMEAQIGKEIEKPSCETCGAAVQDSDVFCRECGDKL